LHDEVTLCVAIRKQDAPVVTDLLSLYDADPDLGDSKSDTLLHAASELKDCTAIEALLQSGARTNRSLGIRSPRMSAVGAGATQAADLLLKSCPGFAVPANPSFLDGEGRGAFHALVAADKWNEESIRLCWVHAGT
jgi:ankyrin repeat protein